MTSTIDETHDPKRQSWVASANGHADFPLQNLPLGVFSPPGNNVPDARARGGIAIGGPYGVAVEHLRRHRTTSEIGGREHRHNTGTYEEVFIRAR